MRFHHESPVKARILVSRCLLGVACRFDGQSKPSPHLPLLPANWTQLDVCPEADLGMGTPRPPIGLWLEQSHLRLVECNGTRDWTGEMASWCQFLARIVLGDGVCGAVLKARSPSCGRGDVAIFGERAHMRWPDPPEAALHHHGDGMLVQALRHLDPRFPILKDEELGDEALRLAFVQAVEARISLSARG